MRKQDRLAGEVYAEAMMCLGEGLPVELSLEIPELTYYMGAYWAVVEFLGLRPGMVVGDVCDPSKIIGHMLTEKGEAIEVLEEQDKLVLEIGDTMFLGMVAVGLLWEEISGEEKQIVKETIIWSLEKSKEYGIDLKMAVIEVAEKKNPENYLHDFLQIREGESVGEVMQRLPGIYWALRQRRKIRDGIFQALSDSGYRHQQGWEVGMV